MAADVSVVIVNYKAGALLGGAVASVQAQRLAVSGRPCRIEIIVLDNASGAGDEVALSALPAEVTVLRNDRNAGYGTACNQGLEASGGEFVCFLNPDVRLLPEALDRLLAALAAAPAAAAAGPLFWNDDDRVLRLPPSDPPRLGHLLSYPAAALVPWCGPLIARRWMRRALAHWGASAPVDVPMLSGACLLVRRAAVERVGGFDPEFFLYYEDADWCRRACRSGWRLLYVPAAEAVHYYSQSAKTVLEELPRWAAASESRYLAKHVGPIGRWLVAVSRRLSAERQRTGLDPFRSATDLGTLHEPPVLSVAWREPLAFQLALHWLFVPAATAFPAASTFQMAAPVWARLVPGRYFARAVDLRSGDALGVWTWVKAA